MYIVEEADVNGEMCGKRVEKGRVWIGWSWVYCCDDSLAEVGINWLYGRGVLYSDTDRYSVDIFSSVLLYSILHSESQAFVFCKITNRGNNAFKKLSIWVGFWNG